MRKVVTQNGKVIDSLESLQDGPVSVMNVYEVSDLPERVYVQDALPVRREVFIKMLTLLAQEQKIVAIKWVIRLMNWGLKESKYFVDSLLTDDIPSLTIPRIVEYDISLWADNIQTYERGCAYNARWTIHNQEKDGMSLLGQCDGSQETPYYVSVHFNNDGIESARCTCPVKTGHCKHVVALLLKWLYHPETFD